MKTIKLDLSKLTPNPDNTRRHGGKQIDEMIKSINMFDVVRPIVCDENHVILCGHGLYQALLQMGQTECDVLVKDNLTEPEKKKLMLADNKIFGLGSDDFDKIDEILSELGDFEVPGYNSSDLEALYGASSVAETISKYVPPVINTPEAVVAQTKQEEVRVDKMQANVDKVRQEQQAVIDNKKYVICPSCGEKIEVI